MKIIWANKNQGLSKSQSRWSFCIRLSSLPVISRPYAVHQNQRPSQQALWSYGMPLMLTLEAQIPTGSLLLMQAAQTSFAGHPLYWTISGGLRPSDIPETGAAQRKRSQTAQRLPYTRELSLNSSFLCVSAALLFHPLNKHLPVLPFVRPWARNKIHKGLFNRKPSSKRILSEKQITSTSPR